jgi:phosphocarrier protein
MTGGTNDAASSSGTSAPTTSSAAGTASRDIPIINKRGLHARASAKFVQMVERFNADVTVTRNGETVGGNSIMGLMMLAAGIGTTITVAATGAEAEAAVTAIAELIGNKFNEEE